MNVPANVNLERVLAIVHKPIHYIKDRKPSSAAAESLRVEANE